MTENIERQNRKVKNNKETCPDCRFRTRYPEHPLCPKCNKEFEQMIKNAEEDGRKIIFTRLDYAIEKGKVTLVRLEGDLAVAERQEQERQQCYWNKAHRDIKGQLRKELMDKLLDLSFRQNLKEISISQMRIPSAEYNKRVGARFNELWNANDENKGLSRKVYGLRKAVESLTKLLIELKEKRKEYEKKQTEKQLDEEVQVVEVAT